MFGNNKRFKKGFVEAPYLVVNEVFLTIQGEGPYAGTPAVFLRLAECNLACTFCDTQFEGGIKYSPQELMVVIRNLLDCHGKFTPKMLVITGGEPLLQDMAEFCRIYHMYYPTHAIQIETAGTVWQDSISEMCLTGVIDIVVSPKTPVVHPEAHLHANAWKYIVREGWVADDDGLPDIPTQPGLLKRTKLARPNRPSEIYVQPVDEQDVLQNERNINFAAEIAMRYGYRLSLQVHKLLGLP